MRLPRILALALLAAVPALIAQPKQPQDEDFAKLVKEWTTKPEFMSPLVDHLPKVGRRAVSQRRPRLPHRRAQEAHLLRRLFGATTAPSRRRLPREGDVDRQDRRGPRVRHRVRRLREDSIKNLDDLPRTTSPASPTRAASPRPRRNEHHRRRPSPSTLFRRPPQRRDRPARDADGARLPPGRRRLAARPEIRENVIVAITAGRRARRPRPLRRLVLPPHDVDETDEDNASGGPPYWGKYVFHDNNRDINYSQVTMKNLLDWYLQWHPPIMHDLHESVPFLYTFSGQAPQNPTLDPILYGELPWFSNFEMAQMTRTACPACGLTPSSTCGRPATRLHVDQPQRHASACTRPSATAAPPP